MSTNQSNNPASPLVEVANTETIQNPILRSVLADIKCVDTNESEYPDWFDHWGDYSWTESNDN